MKKLSILLSLFAFFAVSGIFAQAGSSRTYNIGDTGPGGGIIFYDKGSFSDGWRYLEAAPQEAESRAQWSSEKGSQRVNIPTYTTLGSGKQNTEMVVNQLGGIGRAATLCKDLSYGGYKDWYLPSRDELDWVYRNLKTRGLGGFNDNYYWTSSEYEESVRQYRDVCRQRFRDGRQGHDEKQEVCMVRPIRQF